MNSYKFFAALLLILVLLFVCLPKIYGQDRTNSSTALTTAQKLLAVPKEDVPNSVLR